MQFHPEVLHTENGTKMLSNFVYNVCGCAGTWKMDSFVEQTVKELKAKIGTGKVLCALSGGVDTLNPQCAEVAFLLFAVAISVGQTFFPSVFGDGPDVAAAAKVAACKFQDFFTASTRCYVVY